MNDLNNENKANYGNMNCHINFLSLYFILGTGNIDKPLYFNHTPSQEGKSITYSWGHSLKAVVSHYILTLVAAEEIFQYNVTGTYITIPSTSIDLNGTLSAVSVCGDESEPVSFKGNN